MCPKLPATCIESLKKFGGKAAKLGFLAHPKVLGIGRDEQRKLGYRLTPYGFAVPLQFYKDFINDVQNTELKLKMTEFIASENSKTPPSPAERKKAIVELQKLFYKSHIPNTNLVAIQEALKNLSSQIGKEYAGLVLKKVKVRSSANAEDNTDVETKLKMQPENLSCAIKGVYASLWNQRAVEERSFRRIYHQDAVMGLAIVPSYGFLKDQGLDQTANSVVVTRVITS